MIEKLKHIKNIFKGDKVIWTVLFLLCIISILEVYSASSFLGYKTGNYVKAPMYHATLLIFGLIATVFVLNIKCKYFKLVTPILVPVAVFMLVLVYFIGTKENEATRWLKIGFIPIQPSEIAKGAMVLATAQILSAMQTPNGAAPKAMKYILITAAFLILPIAPENLSTAALLSAVIIMMMIIGRVPFAQLGKLLSTIVIVGIVALTLIMTIGKAPSEVAAADNTDMHATDNGSGTLQNSNEAKKEKGTFDFITHRFNTWKGRIIGFTNHEYVAPEDYDLNKNGQVGHANIAIVSSNIYGLGPGNSVERDFLSQAFSDFIYAIIIEELGIIGAIAVALLYIILLVRTGIIARKCKNPFPAFLAMGLALLMVTQALFNMCVAVGLAPVTGQPLPLISKGGTSSVINCIYIGMILSISRTATRTDENDIDELDGKAVAKA